MSDLRDVWYWVGGALVIVAVVVGFLLLTSPEPILPSTYNFGYK